MPVSAGELDPLFGSLVPAADLYSLHVQSYTASGSSVSERLATATVSVGSSSSLGGVQQPAGTTFTVSLVDDSANTIYLTPGATVASNPMFWTPFYVVGYAQDAVLLSFLPSFNIALGLDFNLNQDVSLAILSSVPLTSGATIPFSAAGSFAGSFQSTVSRLFTDNGHDANIATGAGNNTVVGSSGNDTITTGSGGNLIAPGSGNDLITLNGQDTVFPGGGSDTVFAFGPALVATGQGTLYFVNGSHASTVVGGSGGPLIASTGAGGGLYRGSSAGGNVVVGGSGAVTIFGAGANDLLFAGNDGTLIAGSGNETLSGLGATGPVTFVANTGNELMGGGSGANTYLFLKGHAGGADEIVGFDPGKGDLVGLLGYGAAGLQTALAHQVNSAAGTTITLSDNTSITFAGVSRLASGAFLAS